MNPEVRIGLLLDPLAHTTPEKGKSGALFLRLDLIHANPSQKQSFPKAKFVNAG